MKFFLIKLFLLICQVIEELEYPFCDLFDEALPSTNCKIRDSVKGSGAVLPNDKWAFNLRYEAKIANRKPVSTHLPPSIHFSKAFARNSIFSFDSRHGSDLRRKNRGLRKQRSITEVALYGIWAFTLSGAYQKCPGSARLPGKRKNVLGHV